MARIRYLEQRAQSLRDTRKKRVIGRQKLLVQVFDATHRSKGRARRSICLSEKRGVRLAFLNFFRRLMTTARSIRDKWTRGDLTVSYPPGSHPPSMAKLANVYSEWPRRPINPFFGGLPSQRVRVVELAEVYITVFARVPKGTRIGAHLPFRIAAIDPRADFIRLEAA